MLLLWGLAVLPCVLSQALYGVNQLDSYNRILQSNNIGGLGLLQDAIMKGKVHDVKSEVLGTPKLSGLPPLPEHAVQRGTPILDSDALPPPRRAVHKVKEQQSTTSTAPPNMWGVNPIPELPPRHESKLGGYYDEDGEFHAFEKKKEKKKEVRKRVIEEDDETPHIIAPASRIDETPHPISSSHRVSQQRPDVSKLERRVRRVREHQPASAVQQVQQPHRAIPRQVAPASTAPPFQYRPKPKPSGRAPEDNNLLAEVEEYDDWLDQREAYQALYPGRRVSNPYESVPPGTVLFEGVAPRQEEPPQGPQQLQRSVPQFQPPPPPFNSQFNPGPFPSGPFSGQQFHSQPFPSFPTLSGQSPFPPHPNLNPTGTHFVAARAINQPNAGVDGKRPPALVQVKPMLNGPPNGPMGPNGPMRPNGPMGPMGPQGPYFGPPTVPPGTIVSIPPGGQIPPGFFPVGAPPHIRHVPPPPLEHVLEARDRLAPKTPFENPLVTFFSKLFGKPSGAQSVTFGATNLPADDDSDWEEERGGKGKREVAGTAADATTKAPPPAARLNLLHPFPLHHQPLPQPELVDLHNQRPIVFPVFSPSQFIFPQIFPSDGAISPPALG